MPRSRCLFRATHGQAVTGTASAEWRAWLFGRIGPAWTEPFNTSSNPDKVLGSFAGGIAASYGPFVGIARTTDNETVSFDDEIHPGVRDRALLAGLRTRGDRLFLVGAVGLARATPTNADFGGGATQLAPAFDLSAHADYRVGGVALTLSGALGPPGARFVALSLGAELGWFGR